MSLQVSDLSIGYEKPLMSGIDFDFSPGQLIALIGKNGSGKSTLIKTIAGILPPFEGEIKIFDKKLKPNEIASKISVVLTEKPVPELKVKEILEMGRLPYTGFMAQMDERDEMAITQVAEELGINHLLNRQYSHLSDGEKQIVMIARAVIQNTPIIILDEPMTHLDLENKAKVLKLLKSLSKKGKLVIFSSHDLNLILPVVDRFLVINKFVCVPENKEELNKVLKNLFKKELLRFDEKQNHFELI